MRRLVLFAAAIALGAVMRDDALARAQTELPPYTLSEAFSTAVRFVRVDRGCKVTDKDGDAAFVAFECSDDGKVKHGTMEIFRVEGGIRAQVTLADDTHGMELRWLELFERKLRDEHGTPIAPPPQPVKDKKPQTPDAGAP